MEKLLPDVSSQLRQRVSSVVLGLVGLGVFLGLWQWLSVIRFLDPVAVPTMARTFSTIGSSLHTTHFWVGVGQTLEGTAIGFVLGSVIGVIAGTIIGLNRIAYASFYVIIEFFKTIPIIAVLPLAVLLFGTTLKMKVILIFFGLLFPTTIQTIYGVRSVDPVVRDTARVFRINTVRRFFYVTIPSAAPYIATGLRLGATGALLLDIVAEITVGAGGLGLQLLQAESGDAIGLSYALLIVIGCIGMLLVVAVTAAERRLLSWHEVYRRRG